MRLEHQDGKVYTGSVNQTLEERNDGKYLHSNLEADFHHPEQKVPFNYNWNLKVYSDLAPENDAEWHITSDKHFTGAWQSHPIDILVQKDIQIHKKKGQNEYELISSSNITDNGKLARTSDMKATLTGHDEAWKSATLKVNGQTESTGHHRDTFTGQLDNEKRADKPNGSLQRLNFKVDRTDVDTKVTKNIIDGSMTKTSYFKDITDFEMTENGKVRIHEEKTINWIQLVRFHNNELTIFKEVEEIDGKNVHDTKFLFDISAKVMDENHQTKLIMKSRHSFLPESCNPVSNLTLTLAK